LDRTAISPIIQMIELQLPPGPQRAVLFKTTLPYEDTLSG
jgi:hypothetical protein